MKYKIISRSLILITALFLVASIEVSAQVSITDLDPGNRAEAVELPENTIKNVIIVGDLTFFDNADENLFNDTCPILAVEDFEDTNVGPNSVIACLNPFNSLTNNGCYSPGALIPGFSLNAFPVFDPPFFPPLAVITPLAFGLTNVAVGPFVNLSDIEITFTSRRTQAVGLVLLSLRSSFLVDVRVFGVGNVLLGTATVNLTPVNGTFLGVLSEGVPITRIEIADQIPGGDDFDIIYELSFGPCAATIPTLSEWGLIAMAGILGIIGFMVIRRRKVTA